MNRPEIAKTLRGLREQRGYSLKRLSGETGFPVSSLHDWESGKSSPSMQKITELCEVLKAGSRQKARLAVLIDKSPPNEATESNVVLAPSTVMSDALRAIRLRRHLSQEKIAALLNVSQGAVASWENGTKRPNSDVIELIRRQLLITVKEAEVLNRSDSSADRHLALVIQTKSPEDVNEILYDPEASDENEGLMRSLIVWHGVKNRYMFDQNWEHVYLNATAKHAGGLMSAQRNKELTLFATRALTTLPDHLRKGNSYEYLRTMQLVGQYRLSANKPMPWKHFDEFRVESESFRHVKNWANSMLCQIALLNKDTYLCESLLKQRSSLTTSDPETHEVDAQLHLCASVLNKVRRPESALRLLDDHWATYWRWAKPSNPYTLLATIAKVRALKSVGETSLASKWLSKAQTQLSTIERRGREGCYDYTQLLLQNEVE